jgi:hypothetical protein
MRTSAICTLIFMIFAILTSCSKENLNKPEASGTSSLIGSSWTVVNDATSESAGAIAPASSSNYIGKAGDYFNFTTYGKLYWSINGQKDTATYLISGDTLKFKSAYIDGQTNKVDSAYYPIYTISNVTSHTCTLFNSLTVFGAAGGGGPVLTTINLKK